MFAAQVLDPDELPRRARYTIMVTACLLLFLCLLLVGVTLRMAPLIDDMGKSINIMIRNWGIYCYASTRYTQIDAFMDVAKFMQSDLHEATVRLWTVQSLFNFRFSPFDTVNGSVANVYPTLNTYHRRGNYSLEITPTNVSVSFRTCSSGFNHKCRTQGCGSPPIAVSTF